MSEIAKDSAGIKCKRILLKVSGAAFAGKNKPHFEVQQPNSDFNQIDSNRFYDSASSISPDFLKILSTSCINVAKAGIQLGIVVGAGNFIRGREFERLGFDRITSDHAGIIMTLVNAIFLKEAIEKLNHKVVIMSSIEFGSLSRLFNREEANIELTNGTIVIFACGTGNPLFSTDTAASLRGIEIKADMLLKATDVDGVYSSNPKENSDAILYEKITYQDAIKHNIEVMDITAFDQCMKFNLPIRVFNVDKIGNLLDVIDGVRNVGTLVSN